MNVFDPKAQFQLNKEERETFSNIAARTLVAKAFAFALCNIAYRGATEFELKGASKLIDEFLNLAEIPEPSPESIIPQLKTYGRNFDGTDSLIQPD